MNRSDFIKAVAAGTGLSVAPWQLNLLDKIEAAEKPTSITGESLFAEANSRFKIVTELAPYSEEVVCHGLAPLPKKSGFPQHKPVGISGPDCFRHMDFYDESNSLEELRANFLENIDIQPDEFKYRILWRRKPAIETVSYYETGWSGYVLSTRFIMCRETITGELTAPSDVKIEARVGSEKTNLDERILRARGFGLARVPNEGELVEALINK